MNDLPSLTEAQGREIANTVKSLYELIDFDCVTYIPMRKYDEKYRGFNQSKLLAEKVADICSLKCEDLLIKSAKPKCKNGRALKTDM